MSDVTVAPEADAAMKVAYPAIVVAWKSVGSRLSFASDEGKRQAQDWQSVGDLLAFMDGHGDHDGWSLDPGTQVMTCKCGAVLYEVGDPVKAVAS